MNTIEVLEQVKKEVGISSDVEIIYSGEGRYWCTDGFTTVFASKDDKDSLMRANYYKLSIYKIYNFIKNGKQDMLDENDEYTKLTMDKLKKCHKEPEVDIFLTENYGDVLVVAFTDSTDMVIQESEILNAKHYA